MRPQRHLRHEARRKEIRLKRLHVHVGVNDLEQSIRFYSTLFAADPAVLKDDYAKWMLEDPRVNFAISRRNEQKGIEHLGIQAESTDELAQVYGRLKAADRPILEEGRTTCCYAKSEKSWVKDPDESCGRPSIRTARQRTTAIATSLTACLTASATTIVAFQGQLLEQRAARSTHCCGRSRATGRKDLQHAL